MKSKKLISVILIFFLWVVSCKDAPREESNNGEQELVNLEKEKKAIIKTLNDETKAAFQRDYEGWEAKWVHDPTITKTYINFADSSFSESLGWDEINNFVKKYFKEHPEPEPVPALVDKIDVRLYGNGAWVTYEQNDSIRGLKRETRLMEKENGQWKIASMQTTIYGFQEDE